MSSEILRMSCKPDLHYEKPGNQGDGSEVVVNLLDDVHSHVRTGAGKQDRASNFNIIIKEHSSRLPLVPSSN